MSSFLEQSTIQKGGSCLILGNNYNSFPWTNHLSDFLLARSLLNKRYSKVIALILDRNKKELLSQAQINEYSTDKLIIMTNYESFLQYFQLELQESKECICIFISSLSSLIFQLSVSELKNFLSSISRFTKVRQKGDLLSPQSLFVTNLNINLHPKRIIELVQTFFLCSVFIKPNAGTMSRDVAAEILTLRKALSTNKITEIIELFRFQNFTLLPIANHSFPTEVDDENSETTKLIKPLTIDENQKIEPTTKPLQFTSNKVNSRLITFDSTDPEFDEDSDPDADLDL